MHSQRARKARERQRERRKKFKRAKGEPKGRTRKKKTERTLNPEREALSTSIFVFHPPTPRDSHFFSLLIHFSLFHQFAIFLPSRCAASLFFSLSRPAPAVIDTQKAVFLTRSSRARVVTPAACLNEARAYARTLERERERGWGAGRVGGRSAHRLIIVQRRRLVIQLVTGTSAVAAGAASSVCACSPRARIRGCIGVCRAKRREPAIGPSDARGARRAPVVRQVFDGISKSRGARPLSMKCTESWPDSCPPNYPERPIRPGDATPWLRDRAVAASFPSRTLFLGCVGIFSLLVLLRFSSLRFLDGEPGAFNYAKAARFRYFKAMANETETARLFPRGGFRFANAFFFSPA